jgi:hypothetical protein
MCTYLACACIKHFNASIMYIKYLIIIIWIHPQLMAQLIIICLIVIAKMLHSNIYKPADEQWYKELKN